MLRSGVSGILNTFLLGARRAMPLILLGMFSQAPVEAAAQAPDATGRAQASYIVYLHPVATDVEILVDDLMICNTGSVFGVWYYQFNVTSFLDTKPRTVEIRVRPGNNDTAYCDVEVRKIEGNPAKTTLLAKKTIRGADLETWNTNLTAVTINIALPENSMRPLWAEYNDTEIKPALRDTANHLMKEIFTAMQQGDFESLMALVGPALRNQAVMEGAPPDLFKQAMRSKLKRYCLQNIPIAETTEAFHDETYTDRMAPLNFDTMRYLCIKDTGREDTKGNLYAPEEPIQFYTKKNHLFAARIFLSRPHDGRNKWYVSRFLFDRTE
jgi:hypothetical protein